MGQATRACATLGDPMDGRRIGKSVNLPSNRSRRAKTIRRARLSAQPTPGDL